MMEAGLQAIDEVEAYFRAHPQSLAARVKPAVTRAGAGWQIFHGPEIPMGSVFGWTLQTAFASWEANYREAVTAQQ